MASHTPPTLSTGELLHLYGVSLPVAVGTYFYQYLRHTLTSWSNGRLDGTALKRNIFTSLGSLMTILSLREIQYLQRHTTGDAVRAYAKAKQLQLRSVLLTDSDTDGYGPATLHVVTVEDDAGRNGGAPSTLLYFHGGAYITPLPNPAAGHTLARRAGVRQLAVLEYSLAPARTYPAQLAQAAAALRHLVTVDGIAFHDIAIAGESAGGNLLLALLAHMQQPHLRIRALPGQPPGQPGDASQRLRGALVVSPRTRNEPTRPSHFENEGKDMLSRASMARTAEAWKPVSGEVWAAPDEGDRAFWQGLRADRVLLTAGGDEIYRDDIVHTAEMMGAGETSKAGEPTVQVVVCPHEVHVQGVIDLATGIEGGVMADAMLRWADEVGQST
ncbi:uncharacterized protein SPSK_01189 [Sporothrix schenckii 1099-18]|uniref:Alpha/beta hydrolase fold-3 domain-containing protein n=2 Tax=Sporothrix schenckii TaxID=29908 RepID=U7PQ06_SPOS1|nr:uncharacterized protein SPSK_01189 [Sporothrix schenckii 1099-18]ERS96565.1 hypothetical protein HMPREF1624_06771 [Sporothrix schenckii ATCC 58251]KJR81244.1 hypothetical protein SPSK_01189 [Sporothrix schenckii 1099-18]